MTIARCGYLRHKERSLALVSLVIWGIAFVEYCLLVPANRWGHQLGYSAAHLKTVEEFITFLVLAAFSMVFLEGALRRNVAVGFLLIACGATFVFKPWAAPKSFPEHTQGD